MVTKKAISLMFVCALAFLRGFSCNDCSVGWFRGYRNSCYYFSRFSTNFYTALNFCKTSGGMLVEIDNAAEFRLLSSMARTRQFPDFFIGVTDLFSEGDWEKATTHGRQYYLNWYPGQPDNEDGTEHCAQVFTGRGMKWNDLGCWKKLRFVCEE